MLNVKKLQTQNLRGLSPDALAKVAEQMRSHIAQMGQRIASQAQAIKFCDVQMERITFELARLKARKFAARTEAMNAEQRQLFEETLAGDEARRQAALDALQVRAGTPVEAVEVRHHPRRQALHEHLVRVEHRMMPADTTCPTPQCGNPMMGEDASERLDLVPVQFFVQRHIRARQMGLPVLQGVCARARGAANHRRRHSHRQPGGAHPDQPLC